MTVVFPVLVALSGCAAHEVGLVEGQGRRATLSTVDGDHVRLILAGDASDLRALDAHLVEVDGQRTPAGLRVGAFRVLEGPHALAVWYGPVQRMGMQIGILDLASGTLVWVDEQTERALAAHVGQRVAAEGYVDGPQEVVVQHWVLPDSSTRAAAVE